MAEKMTLEQALRRMRDCENSKRGGPCLWPGECGDLADAIESGRAELSELRAQLAKLREPVSDGELTSARVAFESIPVDRHAHPISWIGWNRRQREIAINAALTDFLARRFGEMK